MTNIDMLNNIQKNNEIIMNFLYEHVKPEEHIDDIADNKLKSICKAIMKWYGEMGEYWCDNIDRIIHNNIWGTCLIAAIDKFNMNKFKLDDEDKVLINGEF